MPELLLLLFELLLNDLVELPLAPPPTQDNRRQQIINQQDDVQSAIEPHAYAIAACMIDHC